MSVLTKLLHYAIFYAVCYAALAVIDFFVAGGGHWGHIFLILLTAEVVRRTVLFLEFFLSGRTERDMVQYYAALGERTAEKLKKALRRMRR